MAFVAAANKGEALERLCRALGLDAELGVGSSIPSPVFTAATALFGVSDDGAMPVRGRRVVEAAGLAWTPDCDSTTSESGGGSTVTLTGMNRMLEAIEARASTSTAGMAGGGGPIGRPYRRNRTVISAPPRSLLHDWDKLDEATQAHADLEEALAQFVDGAGAEAWSPANAPPFDLAWRAPDGRVVVVEVKSARPENHRQQFRLGLGQVLEYRARLRAATEERIEAVLAVGIEPDAVDVWTADDAGVLVIGPDQFGRLAEHGLV